MYCPDCGAENMRSQKFCVRCGSNLLVVDRAREIVGEVASASVQQEGIPSHVLRMIALISVCGFFCITAGTIVLAAIDSSNPMPFLFGGCGFISLVMICRSLLRSGGTIRTTPVKQLSSLLPQMPRSATNRNLGAVPFQSITEDSTRQFENARGQHE